MKKQIIANLIWEMLIGLFLIICVGITLCVLSGCDGEWDGNRKSDKVSEQMSKNADKFEVSREIKVINEFTGEVIYENNGYISIEYNERMQRLEVVKSVGDDIYTKDMIGLNDYTTYILKDLDKTVVE